MGDPKYIDGPRHYLLWNALPGGPMVGAVARYAPDADLVHVGTPEGWTAATQAGGSHHITIANQLHVELLRKHAAGAEEHGHG